MNHRLLRLLVATVAFGLLSLSGLGAWADDADEPPAMEGLTQGDAPWEQAFDQAMLDGRTAYNSGDWPAAVDHFIRAIQSLPERPEPYRNLARSYNHRGELAKATAYYDEYLELAGDPDDAEAIRDERSGAVTRGGDEPATTPANQRMARRALERELDAGRAVTDGDGGAWGMYRTLLDLGFASPELERLRRRLEEMLVDEFTARLKPDDEFVPVLSREQWQRQRRRLEALETVTRSEDRLRRIEAERDLIAAVERLVDGDYDEAFDALGEAEQLYPDSGFIRWYRAVALERADRPDEALALVDELIDDDVFSGEGRRRLDVMRAQLLRQTGRTDEAAAVFEQLLW